MTGPSTFPFAPSGTPAPDALPFGVQSVCRTLASSNARLERFAWLGDQLAAAIWTRNTREAETIYAQPGHHTLSCYLNGGYGTERQKMPGRYGAPSRLCALPGDHESRWWVRGPMHFIHLYFLPEHFTQRAVIELDREPRELTLADRTYFEDDRLAALCQSLAEYDWDDADARLRANVLAHDAVSALLRSQGVPRAGLMPRGGLPAATRRRLHEYIETHLDAPLTLGELARLAALSEFHLARMFRISFGLPPHAWIAARRLDRACLLLRTTALAPGEIALRCGYANGSHFNHRFRAALGAAPGRWRRAFAVSSAAVSA